MRDRQRGIMTVDHDYDHDHDYDMGKESNVSWERSKRAVKRKRTMLNRLNTRDR